MTENEKRFRQYWQYLFNDAPNDNYFLFWDTQCVFWIYCLECIVIDTNPYMYNLDTYLKTNENIINSYIHYFDTLDEALDARVRRDGRSLREVFEECDYTCVNLNEDMFPKNFISTLP